MAKKIAVVTMGGTIANGRNETGGPSILLGPEELLGDVQTGDWAREIVIEVNDFRRLPSSHLTFNDLFELNQLIRRYEQNGFDGVVVIQGTDTIEEVTWFLDVTLKTEIPIVITGAMRRSFDAGPDGPANIEASIIAAASPRLRGAGVVVVFNNEIHSAFDVAKQNSVSTGAFRSPNFGPIGYVYEQNVRFLGYQRSALYIEADLAVKSAPIRVPLYVFTLDGELEVVLRSSNKEVGGFVVAGCGVGHLDPPTADAIEEISAHIPIVLCSRTGAGPSLRATYDFVGSESDLLRRGAIGGGYLSPLKARIALRLMLMAGFSREQIAKQFEMFQLI